MEAKNLRKLRAVFEHEVLDSNDPHSRVALVVVDAAIMDIEEQFEALKPIAIHGTYQKPVDTTDDAK